MNKLVGLAIKIFQYQLLFYDFRLSRSNLLQSQKIIVSVKNPGQFTITPTAFQLSPCFCTEYINLIHLLQMDFPWIPF